MKNRPARVRELIQRELGTLLMREMTFDAPLVTVQAVDLTADFKHCHVHVGVMGTEREQRDALHQLAERRPLLQHELSKHVILKYTPRLHFHLDTSVERGTKVMEIMRQIDEVTPPESAEAAARRTDAYAEGDTETIDPPDANDANDADDSDLNEAFEDEGHDDAEEAGDGDEDAPAGPAPAADKVKLPRSLRDTAGRSRRPGTAIPDDDD